MNVTSSSVAFETKVYEKDWRFLLSGEYLDQMIDRCNCEFVEKILLINNVENLNRVAKFADKKIASGVLDRYLIVEELAQKALDFFNIDPASFQGGYFYSIAELVGIFDSNADYLLHFSSDSILEANDSDWITESINAFQSDESIFVANPAWNRRYDEVQKESISEVEDFYKGFGFSDQCYLIRPSAFQNIDYTEKNLSSESYPKYGGELFEKRVDSYMRNHGKFRITHKSVSYFHENFSAPTLKTKLLGRSRVIRNRLAKLK